VGGLTIRAKVLMLRCWLAGLRSELLRPETVQYVTDVLASGLNPQSISGPRCELGRRTLFATRGHVWRIS
jgi:hypothetical protein